MPMQLTELQRALLRLHTPGEVVGVRGPLVRVARSLERRGLIRRVAVASPMLAGAVWHKVTRTGFAELARFIGDAETGRDMLLLCVADAPACPHCGHEHAGDTCHVDDCEACGADKLGQRIEAAVPGPERVRR